MMKMSPLVCVLLILAVGCAPGEDQQALVRAAAQCSVKKTMEDPPEFVVETVTV